MITNRIDYRGKREERQEDDRIMLEIHMIGRFYKDDGKTTENVWKLTG